MTIYIYIYIYRKKHWKNPTEGEKYDNGFT